jgi:outer membrane immunogenic protein
MIKHTAKLLCTVSLLSPIAAHAADMAVKAAPPMPAAAAVYNWTGLYVGVNGGWGWGQQDPLSLISNRFDRDSFNISGGLVGGTVGAQIQQGYVVIGVEGDLDWADITGSRTTIPAIAGIPIGGVFNFNTKWEALGTVRARAGVAINNWLIYATGGAAFVKETASGTTFSGVPCGTLGFVPSCADSHWRPGLAAGAGFEYGFAPNWTAKAEYLYVATVGTGVSTDHVNLVRGGINYKFGF